MTPVERRAALVERGVQEMQDAATLWLYENPTLRPENIPYELLFTAALTVALEEAARLVDESDCLSAGEAMRRYNLAAAIRALIPDGGK